MPKPPPTSGAVTWMRSAGRSKHRLGELVADAVDALAGQQQIETAGCRVVAADRRPRLDRRRHEAVVDELDLDDVRRAGERRLEWRLGLPSEIG